MLNWATTPTLDFATKYKRLANQIDSPTGEGGYGRGMLAGATEGFGNVMGDMTSPLGIVSTLSSLPGFGKVAGSLSSLGRGALGAERAAAPVVNTMTNISRGINPARLPPEMVQQGSEGLYNAARQVLKPRSVEDLAYEVVRSGGDPARRSIAGNFNVADMMRKTNAARGR